MPPDLRLLKGDTKEPGPSLKKDTTTVLGENMKVRSGNLGETSEETVGRLTPPLDRADLHVAKNRTKSCARSPRGLPITSAKMELTMDALKIGAGEDLSTWVAVEIAAKINNVCVEPHGQVGGDVPLDAMILVHNS